MTRPRRLRRPPRRHPGHPGRPGPRHVRRRPMSDTTRRWKVERREGWTTVTHPTEGVVLRTRDHATAIFYADLQARQGAIR